VFFVTVHSKGVSALVSHLFSTLTRWFTSVDSKGFNCHEREQLPHGTQTENGRTDFCSNNILSEWLNLSTITSGLFKILEEIGLR
jgi:hypothetical protein